MDYLQPRTTPVEVWYCVGTARREHHWAERLRKMRDASIPMPGFGSSDCACETHLFRFERLPSPSTLEKNLPGSGGQGITAEALSRL